MTTNTSRLQLRGARILTQRRCAAFALGHRLLAGGAQAFGDNIGQLLLRLVQVRYQRAGKALLGVFIQRCEVLGLKGRGRGGHSSIPWALRAVLNVCTARKQWVLTLPSEQPMAAAVSATSSS